MRNRIEAVSALSHAVFTNLYSDPLQMFHFSMSLLKLFSWESRVRFHFFTASKNSREILWSPPTVRLSWWPSSRSTLASSSSFSSSLGSPPGKGAYIETQSLDAVFNGKLTMGRILTCSISKPTQVQCNISSYQDRAKKYYL